jgi:hypothetical protein
MNAAYFAIDPMVFHHFGQIGFANGADGSQIIGAGRPAGFCSGFPSSQANFHDFIGQKAAPRAATISLFPNGIGMHLYEVVTSGLNDIAGRLKVAGRPRYIARVVVGDQEMVVGRFVDLKSPFLNQGPSQVADVDRIGNVQKVHGSAQGGGEGQTGPPCVSSLPPVDFFHFQLPGRLHDPVVGLFQVGII